MGARMCMRVWGRRACVCPVYVCITVAPVYTCRARIFLYLIASTNRNAYIKANQGNQQAKSSKNVLKSLKFIKIFFKKACKKALETGKHSKSSKSVLKSSGIQETARISGYTRQIEAISKQNHPKSIRKAGKSSQKQGNPRKSSRNRHPESFRNHQNPVFRVFKAIRSCHIQESAHIGLSASTYPGKQGNRVI